MLTRYKCCGAYIFYLGCWALSLVREFHGRERSTEVGAIRHFPGIKAVDVFKKIIALCALGLAGIGSAYALTGGTSLGVHVVSTSSSKVVLGWTPNRNLWGYAFSID